MNGYFLMIENHAPPKTLFYSRLRVLFPVNFGRNHVAPRHKFCLTKLTVSKFAHINMTCYFDDACKIARVNLRDDGSQIYLITTFVNPGTPKPLVELLCELVGELLPSPYVPSSIESILSCLSCCVSCCVCN
jgi:hypothetical protein